ncbi:MAG: RICIN domain-containing protein [Verrucomicrobia bacterium]|nr:RICIN domain-containing protein [Verrucomicrobiota bacterium]
MFPSRKPGRLARALAPLTLLALASFAPLAAAFTHPGIPLTTTDLDTVKANLAVEPWKSGYATLSADSHASLNYTMQGPFATVSRAPNTNLSQWRNDMIAIWDLSRMWYFTGNTAYAQKAHDILLAWANTQTSFGGGESALDLGDYAYRWAGGAEILRYTWSGWTTADTTAVKTLFANVYNPVRSTDAKVMGPTNKMALALAASMAAAVFNDDQVIFDQAVRLLRTCPSSGFVNTLSNGEQGETGRDQGHSYAYMLQMAFMSEIMWKQGIDVYSEKDNRLLAVGEYYGRYNLGVNTTFIPMGTTDEYYITNWGSPGYTAEPMAFSILQSAYVLRKGMSAPYLTQKLAAQPANGDAFMFVKSADNSTAAPPAAITWPSASRVSTGMTNVDINGASPAGSGTYSNGIWTVSGAGTDIWTSGTEQFHYLYKQVTGDCTIIAKVETVQTIGTGHNKAGVMIRSDLNATPASKAWAAITPNTTAETYMAGWTDMYGGSNWQAQSYPVPQIPYWVKVERVGDIITTYASPDGVSWATLANGAFDNLGATAYVGICVTSNTPGTLSTATFSNVSITGGDGVAPVAAPAAPLAMQASPGEGQVPLRWAESFGATSYKVKRSTTSGSGYTTLATVTNPSYVDTTVTNGTTYYYVVSATNAFGEGANSAEDSVKPLSPMVNVATGGTATASANGTSGTEGAAMPFDGNAGSKWYNNGAGTTGWIQYDFGTSLTQTIKYYTVRAANDVSGRDPKDWQFQGSSDGSTWTTLDTQSGQTFTYRYLANTYTIASPAAYRYYRLNITANNGDANSIQLSELGLLTDQGRTILNGTFRVINRRSGKAFEVAGGSTADGAAIDQWSYSSGSNQKWTFTDQGNGQYQILGVASGKAVDVSNGSTANGAALIIWPWSGATNQKWTVTPTGDGFFKLTSVKSGKVADVSNGSTADGAAVIQYSYGNASNQQWSISIAP